MAQKTLYIMTVSIVALLMAITPLWAQNPDEEIEDLRVSIPGSFAISAQEFADGLPYIGGSWTFSGNPSQIRDAYDENDELRGSVLVEHLTFNFLGFANLEYNVGAQLFSIHYAGSRVATHRRGPSGFSRLSVGPALFLTDTDAALAATGRVGIGYGYDFPNFTIGFLVEGTAGAVFFDGNTSIYTGGGFGVYMTRRQGVARGRVGDLPDEEG